MKKLFSLFRAPGRDIIRPARVAHAIRDSALLFRTTTASLTATETSSWLATPGVVATGLTLVIALPKQSTGDTLTAIVDESTDGSTAESSSHTLLFVASVTVAVTEGKVYRRKFQPHFAYVRLRLLAAGTTPDYGAIGAWLEHGRDWNHQSTNPTGQLAT